MSVAQRLLASNLMTSKSHLNTSFQVKTCAIYNMALDIESCVCISFRYADGTGQLNFGFAADAIANNDHFLPLGLGPQYNGTVSL